MSFVNPRSTLLEPPSLYAFYPTSFFLSSPSSLLSPLPLNLTLLLILFLFLYLPLPLTCFYSALNPYTCRFRSLDPPPPTNYPPLSSSSIAFTCFYLTLPCLLPRRLFTTPTFPKPLALSTLPLLSTHATPFCLPFHRFMPCHSPPLCTFSFFSTPPSPP